MAQNNLYMEGDEMRLYIDVQPLFIDSLENSKNAAAESAASAAQSETNARNLKNQIADYKTNLELFYANATNGLTSMYNDSVNDFTTAKQAALNSINENAQSFVNQARNYAEQAQNAVDNNVSLDHLNQSKGLITGELSDDPDLFRDVMLYAHSTFDISKFTVVANGSEVSNPTVPFNQNGLNITTDGIASGFTTLNYLTASFNSVTDNFEFILPFKMTNNSRIEESMYCLCDGTTVKLRLWRDAFGSVRISGSSVLSNIVVAESDLVANKQYYAKVVCTKTGSTYSYIPYISDDLRTWTQKGTQTEGSESTQITIDNVVIGAQIGAGLSAPSAILDLKYFAGKGNNIPVFTGNKTGIDIIKPVDYTAPTDRTLPAITDDGIASGFTTSKMIQLSNSAIGSSYSTFDIYWKQKFTTLCGAQSMLTTSTGSADSLPQVGGAGLTIYTWGAGKPTIRLSSDGTNNDIANDVESDVAMTVNTEYYFHFSFDGSSYKLLGSTDGKNYNVWKTITSSTKMYGLYDFIIGGVWSPLYATYDLNALKIYVDGDLVYQPCLKIPFTKSLPKYGSKIVDVAYHSRVQDAYEQGFTQKYYVLDQANSLSAQPKGEIYGMIENLRKLILELTA